MAGKENSIELLLRLNDQISKQIGTVSAALVRNGERIAAAEERMQKVVDRGTKAIEKDTAAKEKATKANSDLADSANSTVTALAASIGAYISVSAAINAYGTALSYIAQVGGDFQQSMANTRAILQPTAEEFAALSYEAKRLGATTTFTASEAGDAFTELGKLGFDTSQILSSGNDVLILAAAANLTMADAATASATVIRQFGLDASQTGEVVDIMAKSFSISALDAGNFSEAMQYVGPAAHSAGIGVSEASAALGVLADNGVRGSMAGTSLRRIITVLNDSTSEASKTIARINPNAQTLAEKFEALKTAGMDSTAAMKLFRMEAATAAIIMASGSDKIANYADRLEYAEGKAKGFAEGVAKIQLDTFQGDLKLAESQLETVGITFSEAFGPMARASVQRVTDLLADLDTWATENPAKLRAWGEAAQGIFDGAVVAAKAVASIVETVNDAMVTLNVFSLDNAYSSAGEKLASATDEAGEALRRYNEKKAEYNRLAKGASEGKGVLEIDGSRSSTHAMISAYEEMLDLHKEANEQLSKRNSTLKEARERYQYLSDFQDSLGDSEKKELAALKGIIEASELAARKGMTLAASQKAIAEATAERLKEEAKGRAITGRQSENIDTSGTGSMDVQAQKDAEKAAEASAKRADEAFKKLTREKELQGLDADRRELALLKQKWDDIIATDAEGGGRRLELLGRMRDEEIATLLSQKMGRNEETTFHGRGVATDYAPSIGASGSDGGAGAAEAFAKAREEATQRAEVATEAQKALDRELAVMRMSEYDKMLAEVEDWYNEKYKIARGNAELESRLAQENEKRKADAAIAENDRVNRTRLAAASTFNNGMAALAQQMDLKNSVLRKALKASMMAEATANTYIGVTKAFAQGGVLGFLTGGGILAAGLAQVAQINSLKFAEGGIVPGNSTTGDRVNANLNSREMVLNMGQQARLFSMANGSNPSNGSSGTKVYNYNFSPTYNTEVSSQQKRRDMREFRKQMRSTQDDPSYARSQGALS